MLCSWFGVSLYMFNKDIKSPALGIESKWKTSLFSSKINVQVLFFSHNSILITTGEVIWDGRVF